jgi:hypothetical protein
LKGRKKGRKAEEEEGTNYRKRERRYWKLKQEELDRRL